MPPDASLGPTPRPRRPDDEHDPDGEHEPDVENPEVHRPKFPCHGPRAAAASTGGWGIIQAAQFPPSAGSIQAPFPPSGSIQAAHIPPSTPLLDSPQPLTAPDELMAELDFLMNPIAREEGGTQPLWSSAAEWGSIQPQADEPELAPELDFFIKSIDVDMTAECAAQQLLDSIHRPRVLLSEGGLERLSVRRQQSAVMTLFRHLLQPHTEATLQRLVLPQPDSAYRPPFLHWLMVPHRARLWDLDADVNGDSPPLDPELQIRLVAAVRDHLVELLGALPGKEAFKRLLCDKDAHKANAIHRACAMSEPLFVRWLLGVEDGAAAAGSSAPSYFPPSLHFAKQDLLTYSLHGWLPLHDACKHGRVENAVAYIRALEVAFGGNRWVEYSAGGFVGYAGYAKWDHYHKQATKQH